MPESPIRVQNRARKACNACRIRKRKCNGETPCRPCVANEYECSYARTQSQRRGKYSRLLGRRASGLQMDTTTTTTCSGSSSIISRPSTPPSQAEQDGQAQTTLSGYQLQLIKANSPAVFVRELGLKIDASAAPQLHNYSWNFRYSGEDVVAWSPQYLTLTEILTVGQMSHLASVYFAEVHPVYDFIDRRDVDEAIGPRWMKGHGYDNIDSFLCGVAALGCLFSQGPRDLEEQLVQSARLALEHSTNLSCPSIHHVVGWLLRVIYLRTAGSPQATWMATCTLMHMIETTKLHLEPSEQSILTESVQDPDPEHRRRIYCVARLFNTWVSIDCGRSPVELRGGSSVIPEGSWPSYQVQLWRSSDFLNPDRARTYSELQTEFYRLCSLDPPHAMLRLLQCNIGLCLYRRVRALRLHISDNFWEHFFALSRKALATARELADHQSPWCHVLNMPFQIACTFLSLDQPDSFAPLEEALETLKLVVEKYDTKSTRESYRVVCSLVAMKHRRRCEELGLLGNILRAHDAHLTHSRASPPIEERGQHPSLTLDTVSGFSPELLIPFDQFPFAMPWC